MFCSIDLDSYKNISTMQSFLKNMGSTKQKKEAGLQSVCKISSNKKLKII